MTIIESGYVTIPSGKVWMSEIELMESFGNKHLFSGLIPMKQTESGKKHWKVYVSDK